jgi:hypothetical protein
MTFHEFCSQFTLTSKERTALVWHLAQFRMRKTLESLLNGEPFPNARKALKSSENPTGYLYHGTKL